MGVGVLWLTLTVFVVSFQLENLLRRKISAGLKICMAWKWIRLWHVRLSGLLLIVVEASKTWDKPTYSGWSKPHICWVHKHNHLTRTIKTPHIYLSIFKYIQITLYTYMIMYIYICKHIFLFGICMYVNIVLSIYLSIHLSIHIFLHLYI